MKLIIILCLSVLFVYFEGAMAQSITWEKTYGYPHSDEGAYDICETEDGNFYVVGYSGINFSTGRMYVLRINNFGDTLWTRKYNAGHYAYSVVPTNDNGCVMTGYGLDSLFIMKIDFNGNVVWQKKYPNGGICYDIQSVSDGGYIACGNNIFDAYFIKVDSIGNLEWEKSFSVSNQMGFYSCIEAIDGGYIAGGYVRDPDTTKIELMKLDINGILKWEKRVKISGSYSALTSIRIVGNHYLLFGISSRIFFAKFNINGIQETVYLFPDENEGPESLPAADMINDNKFVFTSQIYPPTGNIMFVRNWISDSTGKILYEKFYPTEGYMSLNTILPLQNRDILFAGIYKLIPGSNDDQTFIVKSDSTLYSKPVSIFNTSDKIPETFYLFQNYPNPFNPTTKISYSIPVSGNISIRIYDLTGKEVRTLVNEFKSTGCYDVEFDGSGIASGVYFYKLDVIGKDGNDFVMTKRMVLLK